MKHTRKKSNGMKRSMLLLPVFLVAVVAVFLTIGESALAAEELEDANVFIEWNSTDGDQGLQFFWDSEGFTNMTVSFDEDDESGSLAVVLDENVEAQGGTEVAFESVEPEQSEQPLDAFFARFPEAIYEFSGIGPDGAITGEAELTHDLLEPVVFTWVRLPWIKWREPEVDIEGEPLEVVGYEIVIELVVLVEEDGEEELVERVFKETTTLPAGVNFYWVSPTFMKVIRRPPGVKKELKIEILAKEPSGNLTITEKVLFELEEENGD